MALTTVSVALLAGARPRGYLAPGYRARPGSDEGHLVTGAESYRRRIEAALANGNRFAGLYATSDGSLVRTLLAAPGGSIQPETVDGEERRGSLDRRPRRSGGWDEREAHDLHGVRFAGHAPLRPLVDHDADLGRWTVPTAGRDAYQVAVGPIHAGVIESGHFRFHVVGDRILHLDARLFYKHRGLEQAAEGASLGTGMAFVSRACAACAVANGVAYAQACEEALGLRPTAELARARTILLELERAWNHLNDIAAVCAGVGFAAGNASFAALTERARRLNALLTGHRFLFGSVSVGRSALALDARAVARRARRAAVPFARSPPAAGASCSSTRRSRTDFPASGSSLPRTRSGSAPSARRLVPRASPRTCASTVRASATRASRPSSRGAPPETCRRASSCARWSFCRPSTSSTSLLDGPVWAAAAEPAGPERAIGIGQVESPAGRRRASSNARATGSTASTCARARTPTGHALAYGRRRTILLPDFPLINKSFELCYACADR